LNELYLSTIFNIRFFIFVFSLGINRTSFRIPTENNCSEISPNSIACKISSRAADSMSKNLSDVYDLLADIASVSIQFVIDKIVSMTGFCCFSFLKGLFRWQNCYWYTCSRIFRRFRYGINWSLGTINQLFYRLW